METVTQILVASVAFSGGTFFTILIYGYRIMKFVNLMEFKIEMMWKDYENRVNGSVPTFTHRRKTDLKDKEE